MNQPLKKSRRASRKVSRREAQINRVGICGIGLIGGSIAESLKRLKSRPEIFGFDKPGVIKVARKEKVIDIALRRVEDAIEKCDLVILSANPATNQEFLERLSQSKVETEALIIDTGSTQSAISRLSRELDWRNNSRFIAGHPMAGRECEGIKNRISDLFEEHPFFFDKTVSLSRLDRNRLNWFMSALGSYSIFIDSKTHDEIMTDLSHLPQLISTLLGSFVAHHPPRFIALAGTGLQSMIRLGGSPYTNWHDVVMENRAQLGGRLTDLIERLTTMRNRVALGQDIGDYFKEARRSYRCL